MPAPPIIFDPPPPWMALRLRDRSAEGTVTCPQDAPAPTGFRVWTGAVPTDLTQWAIDLLRHVNAYPYGTTWTIAYGGATVLARKDHHSWTWRNGVLVTGICIPGITLYTQAPPAAGETPSSVYDAAKFSVESALDAMPWWQLLLIGVVAGVIVDEIAHHTGRGRHA
jgi:hypothetical protein